MHIIKPSEKHGYKEEFRFDVFVVYNLPSYTLSGVDVLVIE